MRGMQVKNYRVRGQFRMGKKMQPFTKELRATSEDQVRESIFTNVGSTQKIKRNLIKIDSIEEIKDEDVKDLFLRQVIQSR